MGEHDKKCIVFAATSNLDFAVANVIIGIEKNSPDLVDNYIIYYDSNDAFTTENIFYKISSKIIFKEFDDSSTPENLSYYKRYSKLYLAKYIIFKLLDEYEKVLWLDADLCIQDDISEIFSYGPIAWRPTKSSAKDRLEGYTSLPDYVTMPNGGVILVTRDILNHEECYQNCLDICAELTQNVDSPSIDEFTFCLLAYKMNIKVQHLPETFNMYSNDKDSELAKIVHAIGPNKFWNTPLRHRLFPKWKENNILWEQYGGPKISRIKPSPLLGKGSNKEIFDAFARYQKFVQLINKIGYLGDVYANPHIMRTYIIYHINTVAKDIHYEITIKGGNFIIAVHFEKDAINEKARLFSQNFVNQCEDYSLIDTAKKIGFEKLVTDKDVVNNFINLVSITKFYLQNIK